MEYLLIIISVVFMGGQFAITKLYQTKAGSGFFSSLLYLLAGALVAIVLYGALCGFKIAFNWFSFLMASGAILSIVIYSVMGMKLMSISSVAMYTMFLMAGGMFVPFLYGVILLKEELTVLKVIGLVLLIVALVFPVIKNGGEKSENPKLFILLSICVFILNGMVGVFNKTHQISVNAIPTFEFIFWENVISTVAISILCSFYALSRKDKTAIKLDIKNIVILFPLVVAFVLVSQIGNVLQLVVAKTVDAAVMFPIVTGGTMVFSSLFGMICFKEKLDKKGLIALLIAFIATIMFLF